MSLFDAPPRKLTLVSPVGFGQNGIDRLAARRDDLAFALASRQDGRSRAILFSDDEPLVRRAGSTVSILFPLREAEAICTLGELHLLGERNGELIFSAQTENEAWNGAADLERVGLRTLAMEGRLEPHDLGLLAEAKSLLTWHARHNFCANCGAGTVSAGAGWRRECAACGAHHFPRTDPVVIMLAIDGDFCLLGRQAQFQSGMYSALAGFVEPGETAEDAVRREVREEAGVTVARVTYIASQPWPFPASLMLGFFAEAASQDLAIDGDELEDARWFSRAEALAMMEQTHPEGLRAPNPIAIAHGLLQTWLRT